VKVALAALLALAGCYSPTAQPGAPCTPALGPCPTPQAGALVGTSYQCVTGLPADAPLAPGADAPISGDAPRADAPLGDARPADAMLPTDGMPMLDSGPTPTWTLIQTGSAGSGAALSIAPTGAGDLIIVGMETGSAGPVTAVTDDAPSGTDTYTSIAAASATDSAHERGIELWYATGSHAGATTITINAPAVYAAAVWEVAGIRTTNALDTATTLDDQAATSTPVGPVITTAHAGEFVVSIAVVAKDITGIHAGNEFTNDRTANFNGWAHLTSNTAAAGAHQAEWNQLPSGTYCANAAAFVTAP
jgi:hypothetical protein